MGKIVKFCTSCEESFAEKFSFCPNCASELSPFEMKPVTEEPVATEEPVDEVPTVDLSNKYETRNLTEETTPAVEDESIEELEEQAVFEPVSFSDESFGDDDKTAELASDDILDLEVEEPAPTKDIFAAESIPKSSDQSDETMATMFSDNEQEETYNTDYSNAGDEGNSFHVTVVSEKNGKVRNGLLLTAFTIIIFGFAALMINSLFSNLDDVASLAEDDRMLAYLDDNPMQTEEKEEQKKDDEDGGGGGGGGTNNPKPATRGDLPNQTRILQPPPILAKRMTNPDLKVRITTEGDNVRKRTDNVGLPDGAVSEDMSGGRGSGGGFGKGKGTGFGNGFGTGEGNGDGSGSGNGRGNGNGDGTGDGNGRPRTAPPPRPTPKPEPPPPAGPTVGIKILSKPKPGYTDAARQNNVQGVVRVRVAFLKNGRIGGVSVVKGLSHGLTEKAIAAARQINFTPPMRNGVPYSVSKVVAFNFAIY